MRRASRLLGLVAVCLLPLPALAQAPPPSGGNTPPTQSNITNLPNDFPSPAHPWYGPFDPKRGNYGAVVRQLEVPARQVVIQVYVARPGSLPGEFQRQVAEIPGYVVTETTTGYLYPERWSLQQQTAGVYQWVRLPPAFQRK